MWQTIVGVVLVGALAYGGYQAERWFNYEFGYESQVVNELCTQLKPEVFVDYEKTCG